MILNMGVGIKKTQLPPIFSFSNSNYQYAQSVAADGTVNWELVIKSSGTLTFSRVVPVDVFMVGGGAKGGNGWDPGASVYGGAGGKGGERKTYTNLSVPENTAYALTIGGSGQDTKGFGATAASGGGSNGGAAGSAASDGGVNATKGSDGAYAFGASSSLIFSGVKYGAGGGGGGCRTTGYVYANAAAGGATGGGAGGAWNSNGSAGSANTGSGGGGGGTGKTGGNGGSGIIIIRNHR